MVKHLAALLFGCLLLQTSLSQTFPDNESGTFQDMLTPLYYNTANGSSFRIEVNKFIYYARNIPFQHPLEDNEGSVPDHRIQRDFGFGMGPNGTSQHHPARDFYVGARETKVDLYASHNGIVHTYRDAPKYRDYLSITAQIKDSDGNILGSLVSIYAHIDLDADNQDGLSLDGETVGKGEIVSRNLYSNTVGGPHLHYEIRYYRPQDNANEEFYGLRTGNSNFTDPSSGKWSYGYWDPDTGYGFGHPDNHIDNQFSNIDNIIRETDIVFYPNPYSDRIFLSCSIPMELSCKVFDSYGKLIVDENELFTHDFSLDMGNYPDGFYYFILSGDQLKNTITLKTIKLASR